MKKEERGAALLTVLMLVAVIAVMAGVALEKLRISTRLAGNAVLNDQARALAEAAEVMATTRIDALLRGNTGRVTLAGGWSNRPYALPLPGGGTAVARVTDGGNCFNLNSLVSEPVAGVYASNPLQRAQFARLMRLVGVPAQVGEQVAASASDWIDSDQDQQGGGAEDNAYRGGATPYLTPGTLMADPSELRAVAGMTPEAYAMLRPWVCTLPSVQASPINANTLLPEQAPLLAMLYPDTVSVEAARRALLARPLLGWGGAGEITGLANAGSASGLTFTTKWFALAIDVSLGGSGIEEHALIDASTLPARLVSRQWGEQT